MTISREKCLEMVKEFGDAELTYKERDEYSFDIFGIEALINRAYQEGAKDMRERAAKVCSDLYTEERPDLDMANLRKRHRFVLEDCADAVRLLEIE